ncbi:MAG: hypothetical protein R3B82_25155 [Sandaracinaceae bacterium]
MALATCSADLARERLGYVPKGTVDDALRDIVEYVRARGTRPFDYSLGLEIVTDDTPRTWRDRLL